MLYEVITDPDVVAGFRLAGLTDVYEVKSLEQAAKAIEDLENNSEIGLIITTERIGEQIRDTISSVITSYSIHYTKLYEINSWS